MGMIGYGIAAIPCGCGPVQTQSTFKSGDITMYTYQQLVSLGCENSRGNISSNWIKRVIGTDIEHQINQQTSFLLGQIKLSHRILAIKQGIVDHPLCYCGQPAMIHPTKYVTALFAECCSRQCSSKSPTKLARARETCIDRYGSPYHQLTEHGKSVRRETNLTKYGAVSPAANLQIRAKIKSTTLQKYGHENVFGSDHGKAKIKDTNLKRYGDASYTTSLLAEGTKELLDDPQWLIARQHNDKLSLDQIATMLQCSIACVHQRFVKHNIPVVRHATSAFERSVSDWLAQLEIAHNMNVIIDGVHYDIEIPSHHILIECDGIYWHGEATAGRGRLYHAAKTKRAQASGYQLIHIFENEWMHRQDIVKSILCHKVNLTTRRLYARKLSISPTSPSAARQFLNQYHLQGGHVQIKYAVGAYQGDRLVSVLTIAQSRFKSDEVELTRFCIESGTAIVGVFDKMLAFLWKAHPSITAIVTFADSRWGDGGVYRQTGFQFVGHTQPAYYYFKTNRCLQLMNRMKFQKHKLASLLEHFDESKSEWENMKDNGYDRIWDCGNTKWIKHRP